MTERSPNPVRPEEARRLLGVSPGAREAEIRAAWRRESFRWHPDRHPEASEAAHERFCRIAEAASLLLRQPAVPRPAGARSGGLEDVIREAARHESARRRWTQEEIEAELLAIQRAFERERRRSSGLRLRFYAALLAAIAMMGSAALLASSGLPEWIGHLTVAGGLLLFFATVFGAGRRSADLGGSRLHRDARGRAANPFSQRQ